MCSASTLTTLPAMVRLDWFNIKIKFLFHFFPYCYYFLS
jgi:hypothetical protein